LYINRKAKVVPEDRPAFGMALPYVFFDRSGVKKENIPVKLEDNVLEVDGQIDHSPYNDLNPVYTEYNVGHFTRKFSVSNEIDTGNIDANLSDGVLTLTLPNMHDGRCLTREDTVESFNMIQALKLSAQQKTDLVAFMRTL